MEFQKTFSGRLCQPPRALVDGVGLCQFGEVDPLDVAAGALDGSGAEDDTLACDAAAAEHVGAVRRDGGRLIADDAERLPATCIERYVFQRPDSIGGAGPIHVRVGPVAAEGSEAADRGGDATGDLVAQGTAALALADAELFAEVPDGDRDAGNMR